MNNATTNTISIINKTISIILPYILFYYIKAKILSQFILYFILKKNNAKK